MYLAILDGVVGMVSIRHELNEQLLHTGGHVGCSTHPDYQGCGIASCMLEFAVQILAELGVSQVLVTCDGSNLGSTRVIEKCGGVLENIVNVSMGDDNKRVRRYWIGKT